MTNASVVTSVVVVLALAVLTLLVLRGRARRAAARAAEAMRAREREEELAREVRQRLAALSESPHAWQHARDEAARRDAGTEQRGEVAGLDRWTSRAGAAHRPRHGDGDEGLGRTG